MGNVQLKRGREITMAEEARRMSRDHQKWMLDMLKANNNQCTYEAIVEMGEEKHCDTVGAMLKLLKDRKAIKYNQVFLMYPMHKDGIIELINPDFDPHAQS